LRFGDPLGKPWRRAIDKSGAIALIVAAISWSRCKSYRKFVIARIEGDEFCAQMLAGGILLTLKRRPMLGELRASNVRRSFLRCVAGVALLDLRPFDRCLHANVWLIHHESPTKVGTYA